MAGVVAGALVAPEDAQPHRRDARLEALAERGVVLGDVDRQPCDLVTDLHRRSFPRHGPPVGVVGHTAISGLARLRARRPARPSRP